MLTYFIWNDWARRAGTAERQHFVDSPLSVSSWPSLQQSTTPVWPLLTVLFAALQQDCWLLSTVLSLSFACSCWRLWWKPWILSAKRCNLRRLTSWTRSHRSLRLAMTDQTAFGRMLLSSCCCSLVSGTSTGHWLWPASWTTAKGVTTTRQKRGNRTCTVTVGTHENTVLLPCAWSPHVWGEGKISKPSGRLRWSAGATFRCGRRRSPGPTVVINYGNQQNFRHLHNVWHS